MTKLSGARGWLWLAGINLYISAFTFGGGYVVVPMLRRYFVDRKKLFTEEELLSMAAIAQSTPGAIAINLSALAGRRVAGLPGAALSCLCTLLPPLVVLGLVSAFYTVLISNAAVNAVFKGMQAGVAALIVDMIADMCAFIIRRRSWFLTALIPAAFIANFVLHINVALVLGGSCVLSILWAAHLARKDGR